MIECNFNNFPGRKIPSSTSDRSDLVGTAQLVRIVVMTAAYELSPSITFYDELSPGLF
jgi:hypothetical protein